MSKVLYISSEACPFIKTGGLGDVAGSLPKALLEQAQDVRLLLPAYSEVLKNTQKTKKIAVATYYNLSVQILETCLPDSKLVVWLVDCPALFIRSGGPYMDDNGHEWHDNALRFAVFCHMAVDIALNNLQLNWRPDVVHCNDWQTGLVPALLSMKRERPATVFTIHNLAYQGLFDRQTFIDLQLPNELWQMDGLEFYDQLSFIKGGIVYADKVTTVSPNYADEILLPKYSYGLAGVLKKRHKDLSGILNGIDEMLWNPNTDNYIKKTYNQHSLNNKRTNKIKLQKELSLPIDRTIPVLGIISRLVDQKGFDIILQSLPSLITLQVQLIVLGTGDKHYEIKLAEWSQVYPEYIKVIIDFNEALAHQIEAASDIFIMPSTFEPCGLNQLYSLRYGTIPVVTPVGGLADTVTDASKENIANNTANGVVLTEHTCTALLVAIKRALSLYKKPKTWRQLQMTAMSGDFSWQTSAARYITLYQQAIEKR